MVSAVLIFSETMSSTDYCLQYHLLDRLSSVRALPVHLVCGLCRMGWSPNSGGSSVTHHGPPSTADFPAAAASSSAYTPPATSFVYRTRPNVAAPAVPIRTRFRRVELLTLPPAELKHGVLQVLVQGGTGVACANECAL